MRAALACTFIALITIGVACGSSGSDDAFPGESGGEAGAAGDGTQPSDLDAAVTAEPGALAIRVGQVRQHKGSGKPDTPLLISFTLANGDGGAPVPLNPLLVEVRLQSGLIKKATALTHESAWVDGKVPGASDALAGGASFGPWPVGVDINASEDPPVELAYAAPGASVDGGSIGDSRRATAALKLEPCTNCGEECTYLDRDPRHCGACEIYDLGSEVTCTDGKLSPCAAPDGGVATGTLLDRCPAPGGGFACVNLKQDYSNCGSCGAKVPEGGQCSAGVPSCFESDIDCQGNCVDLSTDDVNCGGCGRACAEGHCGQSIEVYVPNTAYFGTLGHCTVPYESESSPFASTCEAICASFGQQCLAPSSGGWGGAYAYCNGYHWAGDCATAFPAMFVNCGLWGGETKCNCVL